MLQSPAILIGGIFSLVELVVAALLDFFKREPRYRYDVYSRSDSVRMFWVYAGITLVEWSIIALMQFVVLSTEIGWTIYVVCFIGKIVLLQKDFVRRRMDVANMMFRIAQYQFLAAAVLLVAVSYYVHRPTARPTTAPAAAPSSVGPGVSDRPPPDARDLLKE